MKLPLFSVVLLLLLASRTSLAQRPASGFTGFINNVLSGFNRAVFRTTTITMRETLRETIYTTTTVVETLKEIETVMMTSTLVVKSSIPPTSSSFVVSVHPSGISSSDLETKKKIEPTSTISPTSSSSTAVVKTSKPTILPVVSKSKTTSASSNSSSTGKSSDQKSATRFFSAVGRSVVNPTSVLT